MADTLFGAKLGSLNPGTMLRTESRSHMLARELADVAPAPPTNEQILEWANAYYLAHSDAVDMCAINGKQYALSSEGRLNVARLNSYKWENRQVSPIAPVVRRIFEASLIKGATDAAASHPDVWSYVLGISLGVDVLIGGEGGAGVSFPLRPPAEEWAIVVFGGWKLGLDIEAAVNLQLGFWTEKPSNLGGDFWGIEVGADLGIAIALGIFGPGKMGTAGLAGFQVGIGVGVGGGASIVAGHTWTFV
jgi:hypothetical protein